MTVYRNSIMSECWWLPTLSFKKGVKASFPPEIVVHTMIVVAADLQKNIFRYNWPALAD